MTAKNLNRPRGRRVLGIMTIKRFGFGLLLLAPFLVVGCAPSEQQQADYTAVEHSPVSPAIYDKMVHGDALSVSDIAALSHARVNDGIVIRYVRDHGTIYLLSPGEIQYLQNNGVSPSVIDFLVQTGQNGAGPGPGPYFFGPPVSIGIGVGGGGRWR
jgi:hypothetical protein